MKIHKIESGFATISNVVLQDPDLSWKAKGLYAYIYSKPEGWDFAMTRASKETKDGRDATLKAMKELEEARYILRRKLKTGRMEYIIGVEPITENPDLAQEKPSPEKPKVGKPVLREIRPISNTEVKKERVISNTYLSDSKESQGRAIEEVIHAFEEVHPMAKSWYGNKTQRKAAESLVRQLGKEKVLEVVHAIPRLLETPYCPKAITTPHELLSNLPKLAAFTKQAKSQTNRYAFGVV